MVFSPMKYLSICACLRWQIYLQSVTWYLGSIMSRPKIIWPGIWPLVVWYMERTAKGAVVRILIHGSDSSTYVSCRLYVRTRFLNTWCSLSMISFACWFTGKEGLFLIPYSFSIKIFLNLWLRNSPPLSYVFSTGLGYQTSHVVSTKLEIVVAFLLRYCVT